ncbi:MAG: HNH endonuclease signature motif containing protein [Candidatus Saccharibacteria bacterium]|nr:HNH endonuclease signature motif containing protein [Candidatus Saccharibacteria bacterium]
MQPDSDAIILDAIHEAKVLGIFKTFCEKHKSDEEMRKIRTILSYSSNKEHSLSVLLLREQNETVERPEITRILQLVTAFLKKSTLRKPIEQGLKQELLEEQNYKCAFCGTKVDLSSHADHIVPFKYVGDELADNMQMLCQACNEKKKASMDYQVKVLLKLV